MNQMEYRASINSHNWWITNDEYIWQKWGVYNSVWVETQKKSREVYLSTWCQAPVEIWAYSTYGYPMAMLNWICGITKNGYIFRMDVAQTWHIYQKTTGEQTFINLIAYTIPAWTSTWYVIAWQSNLIRFSLSWTTVSNVSDVALSTPWVDNTIYRPMLINDWALYIARWNKIDKIDSTWVLVNVLTLNTNDTINSIHELWDQMIIVTQDTQYYWDFVDEAPIWKVTYKDVNFVNSAIVGNNIYAISRDTDYNWLMQLTSYSAEPIIRWDNTALNRINLNAPFGNAIDVNNRMIYIPAEWLDWVYTYWEYNPWFWKWLNLKHLLWDDWGTTSAINYPNVAWTKTISTVLTSVYWPMTALNASWYIEELPILLEWDWIFNKIRVNYKLLNANQSIQIYSSVDDWSYTLIETISWANDYHLNKRSYTFNYAWDFTKVKLKVVLNYGSSTSPVYYWMVFIYDEQYKDG